MMIDSKDGALMLSELTDDARLTSNLLPQPISGREAVKRVIDTVEALCLDQVVAYRRHFDTREVIVTHARLATGEAVEITMVGLRDGSGWIGAIALDHRPPIVAKKLAAQVMAKLAN